MRYGTPVALRFVPVWLLTWATLGQGASAESQSSAALQDHVSHVAQQRPSSHAIRKTTSVRIYLVALGDGGKTGLRIGCGDSLVAVTRPVVPTRAPLLVAVRLLLKNHHRYYGQSGLYNSLYQSRLTVVGLRLKKGRATISLVGRLRLGGVCDDPRVAAQLRRTALQFPTVHRVTISINNIPLSKLLSGKGG